MDDNFSYISVSGEDGGESPGVKARDSFYWGRIGIMVAVLLLLIYEIIELALEHPAQLPLPDLRSCGASPEEAKTKGCIFDLMSWCWLYPECHDVKLSEEMLELGPWTWYEDVSANRPINQDVAALGEIPVLYVEESFHRIHCTYIWKKMHRAYLGNGRIDSYIASLNHTFHCSEMLLRQGIEWNEVTTSVTVKYPTCDRLGRG